MKTRLVRLALLGLAVLPCNCDQEETIYEVGMKPSDGHIEREVRVFCEKSSTDESGTTTRSYQEVPSAELDKLTGIYPVHEKDKDGHTHVFRGKFQGKLPQDLGGTGEYVCFASPLGSAFVYVERLPGQDDQAGLCEEKLRAADKLTDLLIGWCEHELAGQDGYQELRAFLDGDLRRDLKNLALYAYIEESLGEILQRGKHDDQTMLVRAGQYLVERGYFSIEEIPSLVRFADECDQGHTEKLMGWVQRLVAARMDVAKDEPVPACLGFLASPESVDRSFKAYMVTTAAYGGADEGPERSPASQPAATQPAPPELSAISDAVSGIFRFGPFFSSVPLSIGLATSTEPIGTNGEWSEDKGIVTWSVELPRGFEKAIPRVFYAIWATPDAAAQEKLFGNVASEGEHLYEYCLWHAGLDDLEAQQWDQFLAGLRPTPHDYQRLAEFRFAGHPAEPAGEGQEAPKDYARRGADMVLQKLDGNPTTHSTSMPATGPAREH